MTGSPHTSPDPLVLQILDALGLTKEFRVVDFSINFKCHETTTVDVRMYPSEDQMEKISEIISTYELQLVETKHEEVERTESGSVDTTTQRNKRWRTHRPILLKGDADAQT